MRLLPATLPASMQPEIHIGPLTLQTFGICFALAFLAAGVVVGKRLREWDKPADWAYEMVFCGADRRDRRRAARLRAPELGRRLRTTCSATSSRASGLVWFGGAIGGAIGVVALGARTAGCSTSPCSTSRRCRSRSATRSGASAASSLATATTASRMGRALGDVLSRRDGARPRPRSTRRPSTRRSRWAPSRTLLWRLRDRFRPGSCSRSTSCSRGSSGSWSSSSAATRTSSLGLTQAQLISLAMIAAGVIWIAAAARRGGLARTAPAT